MHWGNLGMLLLLGVLSAHGEVNPLATATPTGNDFVSTCRDFDEKPLGIERVFQTGICIGFVRGVLAGYIVGGVANVAREGKDIVGNPCIPDRVSNGEIIKVVLKYLDGHPESLHFSAASEVYMSVVSAWGVVGPHCD